MYGRAYSLSRNDLIEALPVLDFFKVTQLEKFVEEEIIAEI